MVLMGMSIMVPVLPLYAQSFGVSSALVGLVIASFGLARICTDIPSGRWSDKFGRRPLLIVGVAVFAVASLLCGLATDFWMLILFRFVQGIGSAIYSTTAMTVLSDISTPEDRGRVMSLYQGTMVFGSGVGPTIGGFVAEGFGMNSPFYLTALMGLVATFWALLRVPETRNVGGAAPLPAGPAGDGRPPGGVRILLSNVNFLLIGLIGFSIHFTHTGSRQTIIPLLGYNELGLREVQIGITLSVVSIIDFLVIFFAGVASDRFGRKALIIPGGAATAISLIMFAHGDSYAVYLFSAGVFGIARGLTGSAPMAYAADIGGRGNQAMVAGVYRTLCDIGMMLGPIVLGYIADHANYGTALYVNAGMLLLVSMIFGVVAREPGRQPKAALVEVEG